MMPFEQSQSGHVAPLLKSYAGSLKQLRVLGREGSLFALLDATGCLAVPQKARELGPADVLSLFEGTAAAAHWEVAPYLIRLNDGVIEWLVRTLWPQPWGILLVAPGELKAVAEHLRSLLMVALPNGEQCFFRYYDPRVLPPFLAGCNANELRQFFGPARALGIAEQGGVRFWARVG